jgi:hypothetical protein
MLPGMKLALIPWQESSRLCKGQYPLEELEDS